MVTKVKNTKKIDNNSDLNDEKELSFFQKMKEDKKYSSKVQLIGYAVLILFLVVYVNVSNSGSSMSSGNFIVNDNNDVVEENTDRDDTNLLKKLDDNYRYDIKIEVQKKNGDVSDEHLIRYVGKSYDNSLEIMKENNGGSNLYYRVDNHYYIKTETSIDLIEEDIIYDIIPSNYIDINGILELLDKASLDHVTDYSSGKKEYVYHLKVKDIIVSYQMEDVVEIEIEEENGILNIDIDYTNLLRLVDDSIQECELEAIVSDINQVEEFSVLNVEEENTD